MPLGGIGNLDHCVLLCSRMAETRAFYEGVMGFTVETDRPNWVSFRVGASLLTLWPRANWAVCDDGPKAPGAASVQLCFRVPPAEIEACHEALVAAGVPILRPPTDLPEWRHRTLFFRDPENNVLEIYSEI